jgi:pimeloyl-ACP methyl ester carboxylesterase
MRFERQFCALFLFVFVPFAQARLVSIGERRLSIDCAGNSSQAPTVILLAGGGRTAKDWAAVQPAVAGFARVCSYDRAGLGASEKPLKPQSVDQIVGDLHALLAAAGEKAPYVLVGQSIGGIYARRFAAQFPSEAVGFVFVDSAHEEQALRFHQIAPAFSPLDADTAFLGLLTEPGARLAWKTEAPIIVLERGQPLPRGPGTRDLTDQQFAALDRVWYELQDDLAQRSPHAQRRRATESGHFIQIDQPAIVIQAIKDVAYNL